MKKIIVIAVALIVIGLVWKFFWPAEKLAPKRNETKIETPPINSQKVDPPEIKAQAPVVTPPAVAEPAKFIDIPVPFTSQSPFAEWQDPRQEDACEEASALMAVYSAQGKSLTKTLAKEEILKIAQYEQDSYGSYVDTSAVDTVERIFKGYFGFSNVETKDVATSSAIISELEKGHLVIVPANGRALKNPHFTQPGPERHNLLIRGYDPETQEFITNDAGIKEGEKYRYPVEVVFNAIRDYPTGDHVPITEVKKVMIVVRK